MEAQGSVSRVQLGTIITLEPRVVWPNEERDFTPWLAENIDQLSAVIGLPLRVEQIEARVGDFELDIQAQDENTGAPVIIENQFGRTDHVHLGKLMTYAAGLDAKTIVWVTHQIRDEHHAVIEWLNKIANQQVAFFLVRVEVIRIDNSLPAVTFVVESAPSEFEQTFDEIRARRRIPSPARMIWSDSATTALQVSRWKEVLRIVWERALQENVDLQHLPWTPAHNEEEAGDLFHAPLRIGENLYIESGLGSSAIRSRVSRLLRAIGKPERFLRIECSDGSMFELPPSGA